MNRWKEFLNSSIRDTARIEQLRSWMGRMLSGLQPEKVLFLVGPGQSGKSVLLNLLGRLVGRDYWVPYPTGLSLRAFLDITRDKRLLVFSEDFAREIETHGPWIKMFLGGEEFFGIGAFEEPEGRVPNFALAGADNSSPFIKDISISSRILTIEMFKPKACDPNLLDDLTMEAQSIKAWGRGEIEWT